MAPSVWGDRLGDEGGVAECCETDPEDTRLVLGHEGGMRASSASRVLPEPPGPLRGEEPRSTLDASRVPRRARGSLPTKELAGRGRFVFEIVLSGGKEPSPSWKMGTASVDVFEPVLAEVDDQLSSATNFAGCCGENDLTSVGESRGHAGSEVNVVADIALAPLRAVCPCAGRPGHGSGRTRAPQ